MRFGADLNAYTTCDETVYQLEVPTDKPEFVDEGLRHPARLGRRRELRSGRGREGARRRARGVAARPRRAACGCSTSRRRCCSRARATPTASRSACPRSSRTAPRDALYAVLQGLVPAGQMAVIAVGDFDPAGDREGDQGAVRRSQEPGERAQARPRPACPRPTARAISIETDKELPTRERRDLQPRAAPPEREQARLPARSSSSRSTTTILNERLASARVASPTRRSWARSPASAAEHARDRRVRRARRRSRTARSRTRCAACSTEVAARRAATASRRPSSIARARSCSAAPRSRRRASRRPRTAASYTDEITRNFFEHELMIGRTAETRAARSSSCRRSRSTSSTRIVEDVRRRREPRDHDLRCPRASRS